MESLDPADLVNRQRRVIPPPVVAPPVQRLSGIEPLASQSAETRGPSCFFRSIIQLQIGVNRMTSNRNDLGGLESRI